MKLIRSECHDLVPPGCVLILGVAAPPPRRSAAGPLRTSGHGAHREASCRAADCRVDQMVRWRRAVNCAY